MSVGVEMLSGRPQATADRPGRRRVLMILSEATDAGSEAKLGEVLRQAQLANVTIYSVGLSTRAPNSRPNKGHPSANHPAGTFPLPRSPASRKPHQRRKTATATLTYWHWRFGPCSTFTIK